jgi:hypothetical protein
MSHAVRERLSDIPGVDPFSFVQKIPMVVGYVPEPNVDVESTEWLDPLDGVLPGGSISWSTGTTAQESMKLLTPEIRNATVAAVGYFEPFLTLGPPDQVPIYTPAIFTAGIVTDIGELTVQVSAQELNFQTDGPIICQALFQRLAPRAPQYGAQINYAGDRLEIYFDPAYAVGLSGIVFGTTSPSQGFSGTIATSRAVPEPASLILILIGTLAMASHRRSASANEPLPARVFLGTT